MMMNPQDAAIFQQAIQLAHSGQKAAAYAQFTDLRQRGNQQNPDLLLWIADTTPYQVEAQRMLDTVAALAPNHPGLPAARQLHVQRSLVQQPVPIAASFGPVMHCPYCHTHAPAIIRRHTSTAGWIGFIAMLIICFPIAWIVPLLAKENYYVCCGCGIRLGGIM